MRTGYSGSLAFLILALLACSVEGLPTFRSADVDGGPSPMAPSSSSSSSTSSSSSSSSSGSVFPLTDAALDVDAHLSDASEDAAQTFCELRQGHFLCSDFENGTLPGPWSNGVQTGGGVVRLIRDPLSGSNVVSMVLASTGSGSCLRAALGTGRSSLTVETDVRVAKTGTAAHDILQLTDAPNQNEVGLELTTAGDLAWEFEINGSDTKGSTGTTIGSAWARLRFEALKTGTDLRVRVFLNGTLATDRTTAAKALDDSPVLELGDCIAETSANWETRFDSVVVDVN